MAATSTPPARSATVERITQEHAALRQKVHGIHSALAEQDPNSIEIETLLREFLDALKLHFASEEDAGFFTEVCSRAPRLAGRAGALCFEHCQLLQEAVALSHFAEAGSPSMQWWRELSARCHEFSKRLMHHESEENKLLQDVHQSDIGSGD
jgi:iron-sulfur cluster repair protein YtfE (RIC family)